MNSSKSIAMINKNKFFLGFLVLVGYYMHANLHYATGIILASITHALEPLTFWTYGVIVFGAFCPGFGIFFLKFAGDNNHCFFFTHSLIFPVLILIVGGVFDIFWLLMTGVAYLA